MTITNSTLSQLSPFSGRSWQFRDYAERDALRLSQQFEIDDFLARLLVNRSANLEEIETFLEPTLKKSLPEPYTLLDMETAVKRTLSAIHNKEPMAVFGDYDVDGATSGAILLRFFKILGIKLDFCIPDRILDGYGPNEASLKLLANRGVRLVHMVDCGTLAFEPLKLAREIGLDIIILDHHKADVSLPPAVAIVNPNRLDQEYSQLSHIAAVGVTFLFIVALNRALRQSNFFQNRLEPNLMDLLDLVALGTVCDVMPLTGLNRAFVFQGLNVMKKRQNVGLNALYDLAGIHEEPTSYHLGFVLGPRINAGGRVGQSDLGMKLLSTDDEFEAQALARTLDEYNTQRRNIESTAIEEAILQSKQYSNSTSLVLDSPSWHQGIIGIVASRIKDQFHRPTFILSHTGGIAKGSGRSLPSIDMGTFIHQSLHQGIILNGGGHAMAAGFSIEIDNIPRLRDSFEEYCQARLGDIDLTPKITIDAALSIGAVNAGLIDNIDRLAPFGMKNPQPKFLFPYVKIKSIRQLNNNGNPDIVHLGLDLAHDTSTTRLPAVAFRVQDTPLLEAFMSGREGLFHIIGTLKREWWQGREQIKLYIEDACLAG
ncbi:MAG: single-stranded-DNA-specific exonuclease RecJ [Alphaproteobacteria bacterium]|nr:single-stranded-DNA-specific exonuclease RecJ [Alphaproteobacteria bacterium]